MSGAVKQWFDVDRDGLRLLLGPRGKPGVMIELVSNALDEDVTKVDIRLTPGDTRGTFIFEVEDDSPDGFKDLTHAYTLFAPSAKRSDSEKRGRFNFGEKLVLAFCKYAKIVTTTGTVIFTPKGRTRGGFSRERGTLFTAHLDLTRTEAEEFRALISRVILSGAKSPEVTYNGELLDLKRDPVLSFEAYSMPTPVADDRGQVHIRQRNTMIEVYNPREGELAGIYELGIPVVEHTGGCNLHVNVLQKVPLTMDRDNVTESFRRQLMGETLDALAKHGYSGPLANQPWVTEALEGYWLSDESVRTIMRGRYGDKAVIHDPSDPEANKIAVSKGFTVIPGGSFSKMAWSRIKTAEAVLPAGKVTPSPRLNQSPQGIPEIPEAEWTDEMKAIVKHSRAVAYVLLPEISGLHVSIYPYLTGCEAAYGIGGSLTLNWEAVGTMTLQRYNETLLHEFAHQRVSDHFSNEFLNEVCRLGVQFAIAAQQFKVQPY